METDSLLIALERLSKLHAAPVSLTRLRQYQQQLSPEQAPVLELSKRCGLQALSVDKPAKQLNDADCPLLLQVNDEHIILLAVNNDGYRIWQSQRSDAEIIEKADFLTKNPNQVWQIKRPFNWQQAAQFEQQQQAKHWFLHSLRPATGLYFEVLLAAFFINVFALTTPLFVMNVYDRVIPNQALESLWVLASGALLIFIFDFILRSLRAWFIDHAAQGVDLRLSERVFKNLLARPVSEQPQSVGSFANQLQEFNSFREFFTTSSLITLLDLPFSLLFLLVIYHLGGELVYIPLAAMGILVLLALLLQFPLAYAVKHSLQRGGERQAWLLERLQNLSSLQVLSAENRSQQQWQTLSERSLKANLSLRLWSNLMLNISVLLQQLSYVFLVVAGVYQIQAGILSLGSLIACTLLSGRALMPLAQLANLFSRYHQAKSAVKSLDDLMIGKTTDTNLERPLLQGDIQFQHVEFSYPHSKPSLYKLNFHIKAGEKVAIIGRVGAGKSTVAQLLHGLYSAEQGHILLDGMDIRHWDSREVRAQIGYLPQRVDLFAGTLKDNLRFAKAAASDQELMQAAELAGLDSFIQSHPLGMTLPIGEQGRGLSGGQIQAIGLARCLLQQNPVLILDEPSNGLDSMAERQLQQNLQRYCVDKTLILITQRSQLLNLVDRIIVLEQGQVLADGQRDQVLQALQKGTLAEKT